MRTLDLSPLLKSTIGFDHMNRVFENAVGNNDVSYPPYNIEKISEDDYRITMALAGFSEDDLVIELDGGVLSITADGSEEEADPERFLHRGIAKRAFKRHFRLAETIKVLGAEFENGLLMIDLQREIPEHLKPRQIKIGKTVAKPKIVDENAA
ncbi:Hsp20 family protein [Pseudemcibacter aquimaris]|uniref:Hsp20 family protein n=1 Tax=Pseudemcibacter aquimaris TaxID=2857064 RepID=UPI002013629D|nr:Hsp20 family protein [Pseudemcibacter aquimaris]MCC3860046.1 Hsp20 family protein [Pseudemcibacter aquimaris]WDU57376.1 Hsp20 family protein [Pseudemcibacter aquimaris]